MSENIQENANDIIKLITSENGKTNPTDIAAVSRLITISLGSGESPKNPLRSMSKDMLDSLYKNVELMSENPMVGRIAPLISIEWCYRHGHLEEDWVWSSTTEGGNLSYKSKNKLDRLLRPTNLTDESSMLVSNIT